MSARQPHNPASPEAEPYHQTVASWWQQAPFYRRISATLGLQGKLVICFMALLSLGLGASCWKFISHSSAQLADVMGEQARQLSSALAMSSEENLRTDNVDELRRLSQELIKSRNILFVG